MNKKIVFIADFFLKDILGGGEIHNEELIKILTEDYGCAIEKAYSSHVDADFLKNHKNDYFIIANFLGLSQVTKNILLELDYVLYEHDHKYLRSRNPAQYLEFKAPSDEIINYAFYKNAKTVFCQSGFHKKIVENNLELGNIANCSGNLWPNDILDLISILGKADKQLKASILSSPIEHKNTKDAVRFCAARKIKYDLIPQLAYGEFLRKMSTNDKFIFFPKTPETLSRVVVEARMMNISVITNGFVGATKESWYKLKGDELVTHVRSMRTSIPEKVLEVLNR